MTTAQAAFTRLLSDAMQLENQAGKVLSSWMAIELAMQTQPPAGQAADSRLGPLMQTSREALASLFVDAAQFLQELNNPLLAAAKGQQALSPPAGNGSGPGQPTGTAGSGSPGSTSPPTIQPFGSSLPTVSFSATSYNITENGTATITVTLSQAPTQQASVRYQTNDGTANSASPDIDYNPTKGQLIFNPGVMAQTFTVQTFEDNDTSLNTETVSLALTCPLGCVLGTNAATLNINEPSPPPPPPPPPNSIQFSSSSYTVTVRAMPPATSTARAGSIPIFPI